MVGPLEYFYRSIVFMKIQTRTNITSYLLPPVLKTIADYNKSNPDAATAAQSAVKTLAPAERKSSRSNDGTAKCKNRGCQAQFTVEDNNANACRFHTGQAVFHDTLNGSAGMCSRVSRRWSHQSSYRPRCRQGIISLE